jgi:dCMP deaminase
VSRSSYDAQFLRTAQLWAEMATCDRLHCGCVLVRDRHIISVGFNGSLPGQPHCDDVGHDMQDGHCVRTVHAESNALAFAQGADLHGATAYITGSPCWRCFTDLATRGITRIVYARPYRLDERVVRTAKAVGIALEHLPLEAA